MIVRTSKLEPKWWSKKSKGTYKVNKYMQWQIVSRKQQVFNFVELISIMKVLPVLTWVQSAKQKSTDYLRGRRQRRSLNILYICISMMRGKVTQMLQDQWSARQMPANQTLFHLQSSCAEELMLTNAAGERMDCSWLQTAWKPPRTWRGSTPDPPPRVYSRPIGNQRTTGRHIITSEVDKEYIWTWHKRLGEFVVHAWQEIRKHHVTYMTWIGRSTFKDNGLNAGT